jgi:hypothetical protein
MAQHDYVIANGTGAAVRSDLNNGLAAIVSNNSGATEPGTMYAYQWWADTTTGLLKQRNAANNAWITIGTLASANLGLLPLAGGTMTGALAVTAGTAALPGIAVSGDLNTGITSPGADQLAISTGGTSRLAVSTTAVSSTLAVDVPLGAAATPSITFTGDLNTGVFSPGADTIALVTGGTNRVHVTSGGLVGIGNSSPATTLDVVGGYFTGGNSRTDTDTKTFGLLLPHVSSATNPVNIIGALSTTGQNLVYIGGSDSNLTGTSATTIHFYTAANATTANGTERMRITAAGLIGIGDTGPDSTLTIKAAAATTPLRVSGPSSEFARIDSSGRLLVGTSSTLLGLTSSTLHVNGAQAAVFVGNSGSAGNQVLYVQHTNTSGDNLFIEFGTEASLTTRGSIDYNRAAGLVRYNATSDRRLKSAIQPATSAVDLLSSIQVRSYKWTETDYTVNYGFIAQELHQVLPDAVKVGDDGKKVQDVWAVDNSKVVPLLTKALQEAVAKIESLEARLTAAGID